MNNSIDFNEVPKTRALKEHLDDLLDSLRELDAITIPSETLVETENIWDLEEVKTASLKIQEKIVALYKLASLKNDKDEQELCYKASLNMKELNTAVNYARTEWENVVTGNEPEEDPNVMVVKAIDFLEEYSIPKILRTAYHIELSEIYKEDDKIPVTILTGFLGAGKTTLLNYILKENHGLKICVIENEYGEQSIDDDLLKNNSNETVKTDEIIETMNGCICCTIRKDLIEVINRLLKEKKGKFNHIIIESTGVADPGPIISSFYTDMTLSMQCRIDSVVTLVDAYHIDEQISRGDNSTIEQIAFADKIVLNKVDLLERKTEEKDELKKKEFVSSEIERLSHKINKINKTAKVLHSSYSKVPLEEILNVNGFELDKVLDLDEKIFEKAEKEHKHEHKKGHDHDKEHKHKHKHQKGDKVGTVCFSIEGEADFSLLREWLQETLKTHGKDMFRAKGIFAIKDNPNKIAIQSTHEICDLNPIGLWKEGEKKVSKFVVIGRNIKQIALIEEDFKKCFN